MEPTRTVCTHGRFSDCAARYSFSWLGLVCLMGRNSRSRVVYSAPFTGADACRRGALFLGFPAAPTTCCTVFPFIALHSDTINHLQQDRFPTSALRLTVRGLVNGSFRHSCVETRQCHRINAAWCA